MKTICDLKNWSYPKGARSSDLLKILRREGLFAEFAEQSFDQLVATLKSGLPSLRNETGGHGQGANLVMVPEYVATYALNLAASKIRFLIEAVKVSSKCRARLGQSQLRQSQLWRDGLHSLRKLVSAAGSKPRRRDEIYDAVGVSLVRSTVAGTSARA